MFLFEKTKKSLEQKQHFQRKNKKKLRKAKQIKKHKPLVDPSIGLFGLSRNGEVDPLVLGHLVGLHDVDLTLKGCGLVLVERQTVVGGLLELGHDSIRAVDQKL